MFYKKSKDCRVVGFQFSVGKVLGSFAYLIQIDLYFFGFQLASN